MKRMIFAVLLALPAAAATPAAAERIRVSRGLPEVRGAIGAKGGLRLALLELGRIRFGEGSYRIFEPARESLRRAAEVLRDERGITVYVLGHTDERGTARRNRALALRRANAVAAHLARFGVDERRIVVVPFGETWPRDDRHDERAWGENRRVEFCLMAARYQIVAPAMAPGARTL